MKHLVLLVRTLRLVMWFCLYLPWIITSIALDVLENTGPQWVQRLITRYAPAA